MTQTLESSLVDFALSDVVVPAELAVQLTGERGTNGQASSEGSTLLGLDPAGLLRPDYETMGPATLVELMGQLTFDLLADAIEEDVLELVVPTLAAVLALKPRRDESIQALSVGLESAVRLAGGLRESVDGAWWSVEAMAGSVSAALAVSRLSGLTRSSATSALALAALQSPRFAVTDPALRRFLTGLGSAEATEAVMAAAAGIAGPAEALSGQRGLIAVLTGTAPDAGAMVRGLGEEWRVTSVLESAFFRVTPPAPVRNRVRPP